MTSRPVDVPQRSTLWRWLQVLCRILTTALFSLKVYDRHNVPRRGGVLLVTNHQSFLDPVLIAVRLDRPMAFLAKSELFRNRFFAWLIRSLHAFPIDLKGPAAGPIKESVRLLEAGHILNIFPEGARTEDGRLQPLKPGVALVIRKADVPVVPVVIDGSFECWPRRRGMFRPGPIRVIYGKPLALHHRTPAEILQTIADEFVRLRAELRDRASTPAATQPHFTCSRSAPRRG